MSKKKRSHEEDPVKRFDVVLPTGVSAQVVRWNVKEGGEVLEGQELCAFTSEGTRDLQFLRSPFPFEGVIRQLHPEKAVVVPGTAVAVVEYCAHEMVFADLCAICGKTVSNSADKQATISLIPSQPALTVSRAVAERDAERTAERLMEAKKLSLVLDLDQTLVHATQDAEVETLFGEQAETKENITCALPNPVQGPEDVPAANLYRFTLEGNPNKFYLKLRPHLKEFLMGVKDLFELHIYTMGSRSYARKVAQIIDPDQKLFRENIVSRDECGNVMNLKNLQRIFPVDDSMVLIIDDRVDVWQTSKNLIKIEPYYFFNDAKVNALPQDKASDLSASSSSSSSTSAPSSKRKLDDGDTSAASSPLPPASSPDDSSSMLPTDGGRQLLIKPAAPASTPEMGIEGGQKVQPPPKRRKIDISSMPRFKRKPAAAATDAAPTESTAASDATAAATTTTSSSNFGDAMQTETASTAQETPSPIATPELDGGKGEAEAEETSAPPVLANEAEKETAITQPPPSTTVPPIAHRAYREVSLRDGHLLHILRTLREAHRLFYAPEPAADAEPTDVPPAIPWSGRPRDIKYCLHVQRRRVLDGVHICFSSIFPTGSKPENAPLWRLTEEFGARCSNTLTPEITHLVALNERTEKVKAAHARENIHIVHLEWLLESIRTWRRPEEARYRNLPGIPGVKEGLDPYHNLINMLEMCYVRDLDKVLLAFHGPKEEEEEEEVSDADQDEFLKWALKDGEGEDDDEDDEEDEDEDLSEEKGKTRDETTLAMLKKAAKGSGKAEDEEGDGTEWDELERQLEEEGGEDGQEMDYSTLSALASSLHDDDDNESLGEKSASVEEEDDERFDRLAALERQEEDDDDEGSARGNRAKFGSMFNKQHKAKAAPHHREDEDDMEGLANEIEDELWADDDEDDDNHDHDE